MTRISDSCDIVEWFPERLNGRDTNKGTFGHAVIFSGSRECAGAPVLVAEAASRAGAGLVTLVVPERILPIVMSRVSPVVLTRGLPGKSGLFGLETLELALSVAAKATSVAIGPGMGLGVEVATFVKEFVSQCPVPLVIDADALTILAHESDGGVAVVSSRRAQTILSPHPGEMGRLLAMKTEEVQSDRSGCALRAAKKYNCTVLLKGAHTLIAHSGDLLVENTTGNPGMATGGTGDVLSGVLVALLAQGLDAPKAAIVGAYVHGLAGDLAAISVGGFTGLIATDLISQLPTAIARCRNSLPGHS